MTEIKDRSMIETKNKWDLSLIYKTQKDFENELEITKNLILEYRKKYENHTMDNANIFYNSIIDSLEISRKLDKLYVYASMKSDEDVSNNDNQELKNKVINLYDLATANMFFVDTELLKEDYAKIEKFYQDEPKLLEHEVNIKDTFRYKKHTLSDIEEKLLSNISKAFGNDEQTYGYLTDSDMTFGTIKNEDNKEVELTDTNYSIYIKSKDRRVRKEAFDALYNHYKQFKNTITSTFDGSIKQSVSIAKLRKYNSAFEASLFKDEISIDVYNTLVNTIHENLNIFHKYYDLKKKVLNLDEFHLYDVYVEMVKDYDKKYSFDEAKQIVINALSVLGNDYIETFKKAFDEKWIDIYPNKNKRGGAYSGGSYDTKPYILLNYQGTLNDVSTLAHEGGHSMHSYYTRTNQPIQYGDYPIFVAEVASTVNEILLAKYMLKNSTSKEEKLVILNQLLELFKGTIYRQVMFSEFEKYAYDLVENDDVITSDKLCNKYYQLNKLYFGDNVVVDDLIRYEWEKVPHFYYNFYVYKYATGISAACKIVDGILNNEKDALDNYLNMLKSGSRQNPLDTLKIAGVDMTDKEVYESAIKMFDETIEEFKTLIEK
jgi:oligoendopeptidase F